MARSQVLNFADNFSATITTVAREPNRAGWSWRKRSNHQSRLGAVVCRASQRATRLRSQAPATVSTSRIPRRLRMQLRMQHVGFRSNSSLRSCVYSTSNPLRADPGPRLSPSPALPQGLPSGLSWGRVDTLNVWEEKLPDFDQEAIGANARRV